MTLQRHTSLKRTGKLKPVSDKRRAYRASDEGKSALDHMGRVRSLPCIICLEWGMHQTTRTEAHHVIHDRYSARKVADEMTIPLCDGHHEGLFDTTKVAVHREKDRWRELYGPDHEWVARTLDLIEATGDTQ